MIQVYLRKRPKKPMALRTGAIAGLDPSPTDLERFESIVMEGREGWSDGRHGSTVLAPASRKADWSLVRKHFPPSEGIREIAGPGH